MTVEDFQSFLTMAAARQLSLLCHWPRVTTDVSNLAASVVISKLTYPQFAPSHGISQLRSLYPLHEDLV